MSAVKPRGARIGAAVVMGLVVSGCSMLADWIDELGKGLEPEAPAPATVGEAEEESLPERPATSTARSETSVITFQSVLEDTEMTRQERIRAFENLDPGALQKPVVRANVSGAPETAVVERSSGAGAPSDWELTAARRRVPIVMYSTTWCGVCKRARAYFREKRIEFEEHDVDEDPQARAEYEVLNPRRSVPTLKIGDEVVVGFSAAAVERALDTAARKRVH